MPAPILTKIVRNSYSRKGMIHWIIRFFANRATMPRIHSLWGKMQPYCKNAKSILDIGVGAGTMSRFLIHKGFAVRGVDVADISMYQDIVPLIYDGAHLPFKDKEFDVALIAHVLHHCGENQEQVLKEAMRVARRVIIFEDTYQNPVEKTMISVNDQVCNFEFFPHRYRTVPRWADLIRAFGGRIVATSSWPVFFVLYSRYCMLVIDIAAV